MQQAVNITIRDDGTLVCLDHAAAECFKSIGRVTTRRASHVEPDQWALRIAFHMLRYIFGDKGRMSEVTRHWPCLWRVNVSPLGGPILDGRWTNRQAAIDAEVEYLNAFLE